MEKRHLKSIAKYGKAICISAFNMNEIEGMGANTIGYELDLTTNQADSAIDAGRAINEAK